MNITKYRAALRTGFLLQPEQAAFMDGFADRLEDESTPVDVVATLHMYVADLQEGQNGFTGEPMPSKLTRLGPSVIRGMMTLALRQIRRHFPADFAAEVEREHREALDT